MHLTTSQIAILVYALTLTGGYVAIRRMSSIRWITYVEWPFACAVVALLAYFGVDFLGILLNHFWSHYRGLPLFVKEVSAATLYFLSGFFGAFHFSGHSTKATPAQSRGAVINEVKKPSGLKRMRMGNVITICGHPIKELDETKHFKIIGSTGTGKSTVIREILTTALSRGDRAVIADPDGGYLSRFYSPERGDVILNPLDARSHGWSLFDEITSLYDVNDLGRAFVPDVGDDPTWTMYARTLFTAIVGQAWLAGIRDLGTLYKLLVSTPRSELKRLLKGTAAAPYTEDGADKLFEGARSTMITAIQSFEFLVMRKFASNVSVRNWVKSGKGVLFIPYQADQIASLRSMISSWMRLAIFQNMSMGEGDLKLWFVVDELDALGNIDGLQDALARLRKFGGRCILGFQSISQVSTTYGQGFAQAIVENCGNSLILRCSSSEGGGTAEYASKLIGNREVIRQVVSESRSHHILPWKRETTFNSNEERVVEQAVMASEIEQLADRSGFLKIASVPEWVRTEFPYKDVKKVAEPFVRA